MTEESTADNNAGGTGGIVVDDGMQPHGEYSPDIYRYQQPVSFTRYIQNDSLDRSECFLWLLLLGVKSAKDGVANYRSGRGQGKNNDKIMKFRRMYTFADLQSNGNTIYVFETSRPDATRMWKDLSPRIGDVYAMPEPSKEIKTLGREMYIVSSRDAFIPLKTPALPNKEMTQSQEGVSRFFILHGQHIEVRAPTLVPTQCTGTTCDRRRINETNCGCYHKDRNSGRSHVLQMDINIKGTDSKLGDWSSLRFTKLLMAGEIPAETDVGDKLIVRNYRRKISALIEYVNNHGGFTVVGWHRLGVTTDASKTTEGVDNTVAAERPTLHFELVTPSNDITLAYIESSTNAMRFDTALLNCSPSAWSANNQGPAPQQNRQYNLATTSNPTAVAVPLHGSNGNSSNSISNNTGRRRRNTNTSVDGGSTTTAAPTMTPPPTRATRGNTHQGQPLAAMGLSTPTGTNPSGDSSTTPSTTTLKHPPAQTIPHQGQNPAAFRVSTSTSNVTTAASDGSPASKPPPARKRTQQQHLNTTKTKKK